MRSITLVVVLFSLLALTCAFRITTQQHDKVQKKGDDVSYGALAVQLMQPAMAAVYKHMSQLNSSTLPTDVKGLRTNLLAVRNILDAFAFAYPNNTGSGAQEDLFLIVRKDINDGYTDVGDFKDLSDSKVNYTHNQMIKLLNKCLAWQAKFFNDSTEYNYMTLLVSTSTTQLFIRNSSDLSPFFWGAYDNVMPSLSLTGYQNLAYLTHELTTDATSKYQQFINLTDVYGPVTQDIFHDYRKLIRAIDSVSDFAPQIYTNAKCVNKALGTTGQMYSLIGKVHDQIAAYDYYVDHNKTAKAQQEIVTINQMQASLISWMSSNNAYQALSCLLSSLISY